MIGDLEAVDTKWALRFTRRLSHSPETVWRALTEPDHLKAWFPDRVEGEWVVGARLTFSSAGGEFPAFDGEVLRVEPPSLLEFRWGTDTVRFELAAVDGGCVLTLTDTIDEYGKAARDGAGWHACLDLLEYELDGASAPWNSGQRWGEVHPAYVEKFGPEASRIGPPEDWKP